jgi:hypothetical protein
VSASGIGMGGIIEGYTAFKRGSVIEVYDADGDSIFEAPASFGPGELNFAIGVFNKGREHGATEIKNFVQNALEGVGQ